MTEEPKVDTPQSHDEEDLYVHDGHHSTGKNGCVAQFAVERIGIVNFNHVAIMFLLLNYRDVVIWA